MGAADSTAQHNSPPFTITLCTTTGVSFQAAIDTQACISCISSAALLSSGLSLHPSPSSLILANNSSCSSPGYTSATFYTLSGFAISLTLRVIPDLFIDILLGAPDLPHLPLAICFDGDTLLAGTTRAPPPTVPPTLPPGSGIYMQAGTPFQRQQVTDLLLHHTAMFHEWSGRSGYFQGVTEDVPLAADVPVVCRPYPVPHGRRADFQVIIAEYLQKGFIEPSSSPYSAPAFLVPKKGAKPDAPASKRWRMCVDYRRLNKVTEDLPYPVPTIQTLLDTLGGHNAFYATLDLRLAYHHVGLSAEGRRKTAFSTPHGHYQFTVLPFGVKRAPRIFQHAMESILRPLLNKACLVYIDDVVVFGKTFAEFMVNLQAVLDALDSAGAVLNLDKCQFLATELTYLGHHITRDGYQPADGAVDAVVQYPQPQTPRQLRRFLGIASYVRQFVDHFATHERQLRQTISDNGKTLTWSEDAQVAFAALKTAVANKTQLNHFDPDLPTRIESDASGTAIGATLMQVTPTNEKRLLQFASRVLTPGRNNVIPILNVS